MVTSSILYSFSHKHFCSMQQTPCWVSVLYLSGHLNSLCIRIDMPFLELEPTGFLTKCCFSKYPLGAALSKVGAWRVTDASPDCTHLSDRQHAGAQECRSMCRTCSLSAAQSAYSSAETHTHIPVSVHTSMHTHTPTHTQVNTHTHMHTHSGDMDLHMVHCIKYLKHSFSLLL